MSTIRKLIQLCLLGAALLHAAVGAAQTTVTRISAGFSYSLFIKSDGSLWGMGYNSFDAFDTGSIFVNTNLPQQLVSNFVIAVAAGGGHALYVARHIAPPLSQWTPIATNVLVADGNFTITATNAFNPTVPQRFFILQLQ